jgi:hypothetical protein
MSHFTQLGLSKPDKNSKSDHHSGADRKTVALAGCLIGTSLLAVFMLYTSGCSRNSNQPAAIAAPTPPPAYQTPVVTTSIVDTPAPAAQKAAQPKPKAKKVATSTYANSMYGLTFRYPKYDSLKEADKANPQWVGLGPVETNFIQPGGALVTSVELPQSLYAGTNFTSAFFNVSVNPKLTASQCEQFAFPEDHPADVPLKPVTAKIGASEFNVTEGFAGDDTHQADARYYHIFQNGMCYEFMLGLETSDLESGAKPANRDQVFRKLNWILSTVKINPEKSMPEIAAGVPPVPTQTADHPASVPQTGAGLSNGQQ